MNNDLISREALLKQTMEAQETLKSDNDSMWERNRGYFKGLAWANRLILDAPAVDISKRPQGNLAEKLSERIEERVCKYCQMNKHCELCEISRVFQIITLTTEEQKGGTE